MYIDRPVRPRGSLSRFRPVPSIMSRGCPVLASAAHHAPLHSNINGLAHHVSC